MKKLLNFTSVGSLFAAFLFFLAVMPVWADSVDEKIRALEEELGRLKQEQTQVKAEQIELKKQATAAAAALPEFTYRPGGGATIAAADKSWSLRFAFEGHMRMLFESGRDEAGRTNGEVMGRRWRPEINYCINNCFYEIVNRWDMDGFGTNSNLQRGIVNIHFEQMNPYFPLFYFGMDGPFAVSLYRQGSGNFGAQAEYDLLSRNMAINTGRFGTGIGFMWDRVPFLDTGNFTFNTVMASIGEGDDGASVLTDRKDFGIYARIEPFTQIKNDWIRGLGIEHMTWFCNGDPRGTASGCARLRIQDHGDGGRQTLFSFTGANGGGRGTTFMHTVGLGWTVGPYSLRTFGTFANFDFGKNAQAVDARGRNFLIAHDIYLWSPKGFLTGSTTVPGSVLFGTHFERNDVSCSATGCGDAAGEFSRNRILLREWDLWYFLIQRISVGVSVLWYDASNVSAGGGVRRALGCSRPDTGFGKGCDWVDVHLNFRWYF